MGSATSYIGDNYDWNAPRPGDPATETARRAFPEISRIVLHTPFGHSSFHGLDVQFERRYSSGLAVLASYGWGHAISNVGETLGAEIGMQDPWNWENNRATTSFNVKHRFVAGYIYELPFGNGKPWLNHGPAATLLGGWQVQGITSARTGLPFNPAVSNPRAHLGTAAVAEWRPDRLGDGRLPDPTPDRWFDPSAFIRPCDEQGCHLGNTGANILTAAGQWNSDLGVAKHIELTESAALQLRWDVFNVTNTPAYGKPVTNIESPDAGKVRSTVSSPRQMQFAIRLEF